MGKRGNATALPSRDDCIKPVARVGDSPNDLVNAALRLLPALALHERAENPLEYRTGADRACIPRALRVGLIRALLHRAHQLPEQIARSATRLLLSAPHLTTKQPAQPATLLIAQGAAHQAAQNAAPIATTEQTARQADQV